MTTPTQWSREVRAVRKQRGITQQQFADALTRPNAACSVSVIRAWEQSRNEPPLWVQSLVRNAMKGEA